MSAMKMMHVMLFAVAVLKSGDAVAIEPLKESNEEYRKIALEHFLKKFDKNRNGTFEKEDGEKEWKRNKNLDQNGDGGLDRKELAKRPLTYVTSDAKQLRNVCYKRTETENLYLDFYFPEQDRSNAKPVVLYTHGGGWAAGSRHGAGHASFDVVHRALLKQGFCVVSVGYRLWSKEGSTAMRDCVIDAKDALRFISAHRNELGIDPDRIYTFGDSAGGQMAQMVLLSPPDSLKGDPELAKYTYQTVAGVSWYGPCDFKNKELFNHNDRDNFRDRFGPRIMGGDAKPEDGQKLYREMSPINYLIQKSPPLLMIQGDKDTTIPVKHAYHMQRKAKELGAPVEILIVHNAGHNWRKVDADIDPSRAEIIQRTIQFFVDHH